MRTILVITAMTSAAGCVIGDSTDAEPAVFSIGEPLPVRFLPGLVEHEVCVATNLSDGYIRPVDFVALEGVEFIGPGEGAAVQTLPLDGVDCPPASEGFAGWARIRWQTQTGRNLVTFAHERGPIPGEAEDTGEFKRGDGLSSANATTGELVLDGEPFPGYDVIDAFVDDSQPDVLGVSVDLAYRDAGALFGEPAADVPLTLSYAPLDLPLFGSSSGLFDLKADRDGHTTLLYSLNTFCSTAFDPFTGDPINVSVFVTPLAGGTVLAGTLEYDFYCSF